jgi:predicted CXXCH cytochrome family protein
MKRAKNRFICYSIFIVGFLCLCLSGCGKPQTARIHITPEKGSISIGESIHFKAIGLSKDGEEILGLTFQWTADNESGTVDGTGIFTAIKQGKVIITASTEGIAGTAEVVVQKPVTSGKGIQSRLEETQEVLKIIAPPDVVMIDRSEFAVRKKGPVKLDHKKHSQDYQTQCTACHHDYQDGKNIWTDKDPVKLCVECHDPEKKQGETLKLQSAYHKNCRDCHRELTDQGKTDSAPFRKCADCHSTDS